MRLAYVLYTPMRVYNRSLIFIGMTQQIQTTVSNPSLMIMSSSTLDPLVKKDSVALKICINLAKHVHPEKCQLQNGLQIHPDNTLGRE